MRFLVQISALALVLIMCLAGPLAAKPGGKGGGHGHSGHQHGGSGQGKKWSGQQSTHGHHGGGRSATDKHQLVDGHKKPPKEKPVKDAKPDKVAKPDKEQKHDKVAKDDRGDEFDDDSADDMPDSDDGDADDVDDDAGEPTPYNKKQKQLANFQRQRDKKIAQAEHLREIAERNGNANLLANADRMEAQANAEYAKKVAHLEKFGVTDPLLNPDGGVIDPPLPPAVPSFPVGAH